MPPLLDDKSRDGSGWAGILAALLGVVIPVAWPTEAQGRTAALLASPGLALIFGGASLWFLHRSQFQRVGMAAGATMLGLAAISFAVSFSGRAPGDSLQFGAALHFMLGLALVLLALRADRPMRDGSLWLAGIVVAFSGTTLFALTFPSANGIPGHHLRAVCSTIATLVLATGVFFARPDHTFMRLFFSSTAAGSFARRLLFGAVLVPAVVSRLFIFLVWNDTVRLDDGALLLGGLVLVCGFAITMISAGPTLAQDEWRDRAERDRRELTARLEGQAAQLQGTVVQRTRELHTANVDLSAAAESNARLALVASHTTNGVVISDADGRLEWCNAAFERLTGYPLAEIKGRKLGSFLQGPETDPATAAQLREAVQLGQACKVEILNYRKDGRRYWQTVDLEPVRDGTGRAINFIAIQADVTERRLAKQRLETLNQRLELATRTAALGIWEWDHVAGKFLWDQRMMEIHGVSPAVFGGTFEEWARDVQPEDRPAVVAAFEQVVAGAGEFERSFRLIRPSDGSLRHVDARGIAQRDAQNRLLRLTGTCRDVTAEREAGQQLVLLNERLKLALSSSNYGVWELDLTTLRMGWDDRMHELYQVSPEQFDGNRDIWSRCLHPEDRDAATQRAFKVIADEVPRYHDTFRIVRADGSVRHIEAHGYLHRGADGKPIRLVGLNRDITAETDVIAALKVAEERWQLAIEAANDAVWDWNIPSGEVFHDERWTRMLGYDPTEIDRTLTGWRRLIHPDDLSRSVAAMEQHFSQRTPFYREELRVRAKGGDWKWILDRGKVVARGTDGRPLRMAGTHKDVTERRHLQHRLQRMENLATQVSQLARIGGWELELETQQLSWSPVINRIFGLADNFSPTLETMLALFLQEARTVLEAALQSARSDGLPFDLELPATSSSGRSIRVRVLGKPETHERRVVSIQGAMQDTTARHESEEARRQLEARLFQAQKMETLGTLAGGIAHDFNNLLTGILGYHELASDSLPPDHPAHASLLEARGASLRARDLVEQILTFCRQTTQIQHGAIDLAVVVDDARRFLRATLPANINLEADIASDRFLVFADATQIHQVVLNLGSNAAHAMRNQGGTVRMAAEAVEISEVQAGGLGGISPGAFVRLTVTDTGHGMDAETLRRIFDPFFTTKNTREGTGLGLAVVHGIVRAHRGAIDVQSAPGVGTTFQVYLPAAPRATPEPPAIAGRVAEGAGQFIGVVDDEEIVGSCTKLAVEARGYRAIHYLSGDHCLEALRTGQVRLDVLLTDQTMPKMQGTDLAVAVRKFQPALPVIIMSGYFSKISSRALDELGQVELLAKPFTNEELGQAIDRALRGAGTGAR